MSAVGLTFTFIDNKGKTSKCKIHIPNGFTPAQMVLFAESIGQLIANMCNGSITKMSVGQGLDISGATLKSVANALADVAEKALVVARSVVSGLFARFNIPTLNQAYVVLGSDNLDTADPNVDAVLTIIEDGVATTQTTDKRGNLIGDVTQAREIFRKFKGS